MELRTEERRTDDRILMLMLAVMDYIEVKNNPPNPFVKGFGRTKNYEQSYEFLVDCLSECEEYFPEIEEMIEGTVFGEARRDATPNDNPTA